MGQTLAPVWPLLLALWPLSTSVVSAAVFTLQTLIGGEADDQCSHFPSVLHTVIIITVVVMASQPHTVLSRFQAPL